MPYWLMKTEPETFSIDDLVRVGREPWTGVRSHFAKFHMRAMQVGDGVLFYHSSCDPPGVAGLARVSKTGVVDETQFDPNSPYFDPKSKREAPTWDCVEVELVEKFPRFVALPEIRADQPLANMLLLKRGMRLSVQPVTDAEYARIVQLSREPAPPPIEEAKPPRKSPTKTKTKPKAKAKPKSKTKPKASANAKPRGRASAQAAPPARAAARRRART